MPACSWWSPQPRSPYLIDGHTRELVSPPATSLFRLQGRTPWKQDISQTMHSNCRG